MAYGAEISNSSGDTVFSTTDPVFQIIGKGTVSLTNFLTPRYHFIYADPNYNTYTSLYAPGYKNDDALGDWDDDVLTFYEVLSGDRVYKFETADSVTGDRVQYLFSHNKSSVRYVQVRRATTLTAPTSGYGMVFYDANGDVTWYDGNKVLDNVLPLSQTSTTNRWFYWSGTWAIWQGSSTPCGTPSYRGIQGQASGFVKESTNMGNYNLFTRDTRYCGLTWDNSTHGFSANVDWDAI